MAFFSRKPLIVVHSDRMHADDLFAVAMLLELLSGKAKVVRSVDDAVIVTGDYAVDIGRVYDPSKNRFDHHQGGVGARPDGVSYASAGLVWKKFGTQIAGSVEAAALVDKKLVESIDAHDTGDVSPKPIIGDLYNYALDDMTGAFCNTWKEQGKRSVDDSFFYLLPIARAILRREIIRAQDRLEAKSLVLAAYDAADDKRVLVFDKTFPLDALEEKTEVLYVVSPESRAGGWCVRTVRKNPREYPNRKDLPAAWAGKSGADMAAASGVPDATFCHLKRFLAVAKTKEGAIALAQKAVAE